MQALIREFPGREEQIRLLCRLLRKVFTILPFFLWLILLETGLPPDIYIFGPRASGKTSIVKRVFEVSVSLV